MDKSSAGPAAQAAQQLRLLRATFQLAVGYANGENVPAGEQPQQAAADEQEGPETQLRYYSLFKQATVGPCREEQPSMLNFTKRAKHDAWKNLGEMKRDEARALYVAELDAREPGWRDAVEAAHKIKFRSKL